MNESSEDAPMEARDSQMMRQSRSSGSGYTSPESSPVMMKAKSRLTEETRYVEAASLEDRLKARLMQS